MYKISFSILVVSVYCSFSALYGQPTKTYRYGYDPNGNRESRQVEYIPESQGGEGQPVVEPELLFSSIEKKKSANMFSSTDRISIFPNAVDKVVHISFGEQQVHTEEVRVLDAHGKILFREEDIDGDFELPFGLPIKSNDFKL